MRDLARSVHELWRHFHRQRAVGAPLAGVVLFCMTAAGCTADEEPSRRPFIESGHIRLYHEVDPECAGEIDDAAAFLDRALVAMAAHLAVPVPETVEYHLLGEGVWADAVPCPEALGCTNQLGVAYGQRIVPHELGHALLRHAVGGSRDSFFEEGVAEALGGQWSTTPVDVPASIDDLLGVELIPQNRYDLAGKLVGYLLVERGPAVLLDLLEDIPKGVSAADVRSAFANAYGVSIEAALADVAAAPFALASLGIGYCSGAEAFALDDGELEVTRSMAACGYPIGSFSIDLAESGAHQIEAFGSDPGTFFSMRRCPLASDGSLVSPFAASNYYNPRRTQIAELGSGRYFVGYLGEAGIESTLAITSTPRGLSCAEAVEVSAEHDSFVVTPAAGASLSVFVRASSALDADVRVEPETSNAALLCDACEAGNCVVLHQGDLVALEPDTTYRLEFTADAVGDEVVLSFRASD